MTTLDDVAGLVAALPETAEGERHGNRAWSVGEKVFAWERPFSKADIKRFGDATPPADPILAVRTQDLNEKEAMLAVGIEGVFTIPHFDNYPAVLVELDAVPAAALRDLLTDAYLATAPPAIAGRYAAGS